jgi:SPX domain protein involved in polyphosphate accumulation
MKFGRNYHHYQIAEWADKYMNYGALKQMCKGSAEGVDFEGKQIQYALFKHF